MNDTPNIVARYVAERYRDLTPAERVRMAADMYDAAVALARAGLRAEFGDLSEAEVRRKLLHRLHGEELTAAQLDEICRAWTA